MTEIYFPFDAGAGSSIVESQWSKMARLWRADGVIYGLANKLEVYGDSSGMQVKMKTGSAFIEGGYYENDALKTIAIDPSDPTLNRIDVIVLRLDWAANTILAAVLKGVNAASPVPTAVTQTFGTLWEIALAQVAVDAGTGTIAAGKVSDYRIYSSDVPGCVLGKTANQNGLVGGVQTALLWDYEHSDRWGFHSLATNTHLITIPAGLGGIYVFHTNVRFAARSVTLTILDYVTVLLNGATTVALAQYPATITVSNKGSLSGEVLLAAGDKLQVGITPGENMDIVPISTYHPNFSVHWLRPA